MPSRHLTQFDQQAASRSFLQFSTKKLIEFQFPLETLSDSRKTSWNVHEVQGKDPIPAFKNNGAREMSFKATYIVEDFTVGGDGGGDIWSIQKIKNQVNTLKGYFTLFGNSNIIDTFIVQFYHNFVTGPKPLSCRMQNVSCSYSKTLVGNPDTPLHPIKTEVTFDISTFTDGVSSDEARVFAESISRFPEATELWY